MQACTESDCMIIPAALRKELNPRPSSYNDSKVVITLCPISATADAINVSCSDQFICMCLCILVLAHTGIQVCKKEWGATMQV